MTAIVTEADRERAQGVLDKLAERERFARATESYSLNMIALAIAEQRERDARIVDKFDGPRGRRFAHIAAAIRNQGG